MFELRSTIIVCRAFRVWSSLCSSRLDPGRLSVRGMFTMSDFARRPTLLELNLALFGSISQTVRLLQPFVPSVLAEELVAAAASFSAAALRSSRLDWDTVYTSRLD